VIRLLLVDDDPAACAAIKSGLGAEYSVMVLHDGEGFERAVREFMPRVVLLDINLPGRNGLKLLNEIKPLLKDILVLMVSVRGADEDVVRAFEIGAGDYVTKPFSLAVLRARIKRILNFRPAGTSFRLGRVTIDLASGKILDGTVEIPLSRKELLVLRCLLANPGQILTREQILDFVWGYDYEGTDRTVDNVVAALRKKLRDGDNMPPLLSSHRGLGYRLEVRSARERGD